MHFVAFSRLTLCTHHRGRTASYPTAPAHLPACGIIAPGSSGKLVFRSSLIHFPCHPRFRPVHNPWFLNAKLLYQLVEPWPIIALTLASLPDLVPQQFYRLKVEQVQACLHRSPAPWRLDPYQDWSFTRKQTMTFQDTRASVRSPPLN